MLLVLNSWMEHGSTSKNGDQSPCSIRRDSKCTKKGTLGLSVGPGVIMSPCPPHFHRPCLLHSGNDSPRNKMEDQRRFPGHDANVRNHEILMFFFWPLNTKIASPRRRNSNFHSGVTRLPIEMNVNISNLFLQVLQIPAFCVWAPETLKSISSPLQGRRVSRLPCFYSAGHSLRTSLTI